MISFLCAFIPIKKKRRMIRKNWIWNTILKEIDRDKETMLSGLSPEKRNPSGNKKSGINQKKIKKNSFFSLLPLAKSKK